MDFSQVGIGLATINGPERIASVLNDLFSLNPEMPKDTVYVIDDGSSPRDLDLVREVCKNYGVALGEHRRNLGISASWNHIGARFEKRDLALILNDDIRLVCHWLEALCFFLVNNPSAGMVGLHARVGGKLTCTHAGEKKFEGDLDFSRPHRGICSNGFCFGIRIADWNGAGRFDEMYQSFSEETDFGCRLITRLGKFSYNIPFPVIDHEWGRTFFENQHLLAEMRMKLSQKRFRGVWGADLNTLYPKMVASPPEELTWLTADGPQSGLPLDVVR